MAKLSRRISAEKDGVAQVLEDLRTAMATKEKSVIELAAIATFLHNIYSGIENILKQILSAKNIEIPKSDIWHKQLLDLTVSHGILSDKLSDDLHEYLAFRHFFVHSYGFMLQEAHLVELGKNIPDIWSRFLREIEAFIGPVDT